MKWLMLLFASVLFVACNANKENLPGSYKLAPPAEEKDNYWKKAYSLKNNSATDDKTALNFIISEQAKWDLDSYKGQISYVLSVKNEKPVITLKVSIGEVESTQSQFLIKDTKTPQKFSVVINDVKIESAIICREESCKTIAFSFRTIRQDPTIKFYTAPYTALWEMTETDGALRLVRTGYLQGYNGTDLYNNPDLIFDSAATSVSISWHNY